MDETRLQKNLKLYKYVSPSLTLFERLFLNDFWCWVAYNVWPIWLAPNAVTFLGFMFMLPAYAWLLVASPHLDGSAGLLWAGIAGVCTFLYQTCDGSDGKQARRTSSGSALGEIFDHGVDALVTTMIYSFFMELGAFTNLVIFSPVLCIAIQTCFYTSNLTLLHKGKQQFNELDAQEGEIFLAAMLVLVSFFGRQMFLWRVQLPSFASTLQSLPPTLFGPEFSDGEFKPVTILCLCVGSCCMFLNAVKGFIGVLTYYQNAAGADTTSEGRGVASLLHQMLSLVLMNSIAFVSWLYAAKDPSDRYAMVTWLLVTQCSFGYLMNKALITRVGHVPFPALLRNRGLWGNAFMLLVNWLAATNKVSGEFIPLLRWAVVIGVTFAYLQYTIKAGRCLARLLGVMIFHIKTKV